MESRPVSKYSHGRAYIKSSPSSYLMETALPEKRTIIFSRHPLHNYSPVMTSCVCEQTEIEADPTANSNHALTICSAIP